MTNKRWLRIIPVAFIRYTFAFVDRTNVSLALPLMSRELHMDAAQAGAAMAHRLARLVYRMLKYELGLRFQVILPSRKFRSDTACISRLSSPKAWGKGASVHLPAMGVGGIEVWIGIGPSAGTTA
jgi:hypothetical protein